jgi:hypothetical protein
VPPSEPTFTLEEVRLLFNGLGRILLRYVTPAEMVRIKAEWAIYLSRFRKRGRR